MKKYNSDNASCNYFIRHILNSRFLVVISIFLFNASFAQKGRNITEAPNPECYAKVGNIKSRTVQKKIFCAQEGIIAFIKISLSHWEPIVVNSFSVLILRDSSVVFQYKNTGNKFESSLRSAFQNLQSNDSILIYSIDTRLADKKTIFLNPLELKIE